MGKTSFGELIRYLLKRQNWNLFSEREKKNREVIDVEMIFKL